MKFLGRYSFNDVMKGALARTRDEEEPTEEPEEEAEPEEVAVIDGSKYVVERSADGNYHVVAISHTADESTQDAAPHQARLATINRKNREFWRQR